MKVSVFLLGALTAGVFDPGDAPTVISAPQALRITPMTLEQGAAEFRRICIDSEDGLAGFDAAVEASELGFERAPPETRVKHIWESRYGSAALWWERLEDGRTAFDCQLRFAVREQPVKSALLEAIEEALAPGRPRDGDGVAVYWDSGDGFETGLSYHPAASDLRYFGLRWRRVLPEQAD